MNILYNISGGDINYGLGTGLSNVRSATDLEDGRPSQFPLTRPRRRCSRSSASLRVRTGAFRRASGLMSTPIRRTLVQPRLIGVSYVFLSTTS